MAFMKRPAATNKEIDLEAAGWVVRWEDSAHVSGSKEQTRWFAWLRRSPRHVQSYFDTAELFERLGRMDPEARIDVDEWLADRRAPVVSLASRHAAQASRGSTPAFSRRKWQIAAIAASLGAVVFAGMLWLGVPSPGAGDHRTTVGEQATFRLEDGSVMVLNTRSRARVAFTEEQRTIELSGEALFTVARDAQRPFYVRTHSATVRAVGTQFNVHGEADRTRVAVVEGVVKVTVNAPDAAKTGGAAPVSLSAGEAASVSHGRIARERTADVKAAVAWQRQQLVFVDAPLAEVVAQFNRYNKRQISVDEALGRDKHLSGTFDALHPRSLLLYLRKDSALIVEESDSGVVVRGE